MDISTLICPSYCKRFVNSLNLMLPWFFNLLLSKWSNEHPFSLISCFVLQMIPFKRAVYGGNNHAFSPMMCPRVRNLWISILIFIWLGTPLVRPPSSVLNSLSTRGWNLFVQSVDCSDSMPMEANLTRPFANYRSGNDRHQRVKSYGGRLLLCLSKYLQQMSLDRKCLYTFIGLLRKVDALHDRGKWKTGSKWAEVEGGRRREGCDLHTAGTTRCLSGVDSLPASGVPGHLRFVYPF